MNTNKDNAILLNAKSRNSVYTKPDDGNPNKIFYLRKDRPPSPSLTIITNNDANNNILSAKISLCKKKIFNSDNHQLKKTSGLTKVDDNKDKERDKYNKSTRRVDSNESDSRLSSKDITKRSNSCKKVSGGCVGKFPNQMQQKLNEIQTRNNDECPISNNDFSKKYYRNESFEYTMKNLMCTCKARFHANRNM